MRAVFIGAGDLTLITAQQLLKSGHEVVIIERDKARIDELTTGIGAGFIHGDGSKPAILREADPAATEFLFSLTRNDQSNIIASLVGRSLGFKRIVTRIDDPSYQHICIELGLTDVIVPNFTIARYLADMCAGQNPLEISSSIKGDARIFSFVIHEEDAGPLEKLKLPDSCRVILFYRNDKFMLPETTTELVKGDEIVVIAHRKVLPELEEKWGHKLKENSAEPK